jgi:polygalacturonase
LIVQAGVFISGAVQLRSNVTFFLENGAILKGSTKIDDYILNGIRVGLIYAENCENIMIKGDGIIDGNGDEFNYLKKPHDFDSGEFTRQGITYASDSSLISDGPVKPHEQRPWQMIIFANCNNVRIQDVTIMNSPFWTVHLADCNGAVISGVRILNNLFVANNDRIDCTSCSNVIISNCEIVGGDDALVLNGYSVHHDLPGFKDIRHVSENIVVNNCILMSRSSGIRIGGIDQNPMRNYSFNNIVIHHSNRGIGIFTGIEGGIENISFSDITIETRLHSGDWWGKAEPIHIHAVPTSEGRKAGPIKGVHFRNIKAISENGVIVYGTDKGIISDITFEEMDLRIKNGTMQQSYGGNFDLRPTADLKLSLFCHDIPGIFLKNADNVNIIHSKIVFEEKMEDFFTYGIWAEDFQNLQLSGLNAKSPKATEDTLICLKNGKDFTFQNSLVHAPEKSFLKTVNVTGLVHLSNNQFSSK